MRKLTLYDQIAILVPGSILLFSIIFISPKLYILFGKEGITVGGLGLFGVVAFATGHVLAGFGQILEETCWSFFGGPPQHWITDNRSIPRGKISQLCKPLLLTDEQLKRLEEQLRKRLNLLENRNLTDLPTHEWPPMFTQLYRDARDNNCGRIDIFLTVRALNRNLTATLFLITIAFALYGDRYLSLLSLISALALLVGMHHSAVRFAEEVFSQFLLLPNEPAASS